MTLLPSTPLSSLVNHPFGPPLISMPLMLFSVHLFSQSVNSLIHPFLSQSMLTTVYPAACQTSLQICSSTLTSAHQKLNILSALLPTSKPLWLLHFLSWVMTLSFTWLPKQRSSVSVFAPLPKLCLFCLLFLCCSLIFTTTAVPSLFPTGRP